MSAKSDARFDRIEAKFHYLLAVFETRFEKLEATTQASVGAFEARILASIAALESRTLTRDGPASLAAVAALSGIFWAIAKAAK